MTFPETFYTIDGLLILFVLLFGLAGCFRGLAGELARLFSLIFLLAGFCFAYPLLMQWAAQHWSAGSAMWVQVLSGLVLFVVCFFLFFLLRFVFKRVLKEAISGVTDKVVGGFFGLLFGALIGLSSLCVISMIPHEHAYYVLSERSVVGGWVCQVLTPRVYPRLMEFPIFAQEED